MPTDKDRRYGSTTPAWISSKAVFEESIRVCIEKGAELVATYTILEKFTKETNPIKINLIREDMEKFALMSLKSPSTSAQEEIKSTQIRWNRNLENIQSELKRKALASKIGPDDLTGMIEAHKLVELEKVGDKLAAESKKSPEKRLEEWLDEGEPSDSTPPEPKT